MADAEEEEKDSVGELRQPVQPRPASDLAELLETAPSQDIAASAENLPAESELGLVEDNAMQDMPPGVAPDRTALEQEEEATQLESQSSAIPKRDEPPASNLLDLFEKDLPHAGATPASPASEDLVTEYLPATLSSALMQAREARAAAAAAR
ncbi:unnamed protein product, partial [Symbiodinium pilosum]